MHVMACDLAWHVHGRNSALSVFASGKVDPNLNLAKCVRE